MLWKVSKTPIEIVKNTVKIVDIAKKKLFKILQNRFKFHKNHWQCYKSEEIVKNAWNGAQLFKIT